ncbi:unnamed protein product [Calypogeia fissa]
MGTEAVATDFRSLFEQKEKELVRLCVQKEKELIEICEKQVKDLQQQVLDRNKNIADLNAKFCSLKEDFKYNLELLDGRDAELSQYESELSALQDSAKQAERKIHKTHEKLVESERERLQERSKANEKDKLYQRTLLDMKGQMESLHLTKEQLLTMHKQAFKTACAELKSEVEKKQVDMEQHSKLLEAHTVDRIRIQELQSQLVLDGVKHKLSVAETTIKDMERKRDAADEEYSQAVEELRDTIRERDKSIKQMSAERQQLQSEKDNIKSKADLDARKSTEKLQHIEAAHRQELLQMKQQIEDFQRRLESAESRLPRCDEQLANYLAKVGELETEVQTHGQEMNAKLESVEAFIREAAQLQDQKVQVCPVPVDSPNLKVDRP